MRATAAETQAIARMIERSKTDLCYFNDVVLGRPRYWSKQREIARALMRYRIVIGRAGNSVGKSFLIGGVATGLVAPRPGSLCLLTAPDNRLISGVGFYEIRRAVEGSRIPLGCTLSESENAIPQRCSFPGTGWGIEGYSPQAKSVVSMSGRHRHDLFIIVDEASGITRERGKALLSLNPSKMLVLGNPIEADCWFRDLSKQAEAHASDPSVPDHLKTVEVVIRSTDSPDRGKARSKRGLADAGLIESFRSFYGEDSPEYRSHILAEWPDTDRRTLIPPGWLDAAWTNRRPAPWPSGRPVMGVDLGEGEGGDRTVIVVRDDLGIGTVVASSRMDQSEAAENIRRLAEAYGVAHDRIIYDAGGAVGRSLPQFLRAKGIFDAKGYHGGAGAGEYYENLRSVVFFLLMRRLDPRLPESLARVESVNQAMALPRPIECATPSPTPIARVQPPFCIPQSIGEHWPRLRQELAAIRYSSKGKKFALTPKPELRKALGRSPDYADALAMTFWVDRG